MRIRGLAVVALLASVAGFAACSASPGQGFSPNGDGSDDSDAGHKNNGGSVGGGNGGGGTLLPDGGILLPDGGVISPTPDGGFLGDGGAPISRVSCGGSYCRGDQTCNGGSCVFACTGTQVPGDYATIQAAINATINGAADVTLCLKAQTYGESVSISGSPATPKKLTIQGVSSGSSIITALTASGGAFSALSIRGVGFTNSLQVSGVTAPVALVGDKFSGMSGSYAFYDYGSSDVTVDGCEITSPTSTYGVYFYANYNGPAQKLVVKNSYLHDSAFGAYVVMGSYSGSGTANVSFINDTFNSATTALYTNGSGVPLTLTYANDVIVNSKTYGVDQEATNATVVAKNNALFGNANNYSGSAVDGTGYVKADLKLDTAQNPPGLGSGSPARGAADVAMTPATDFWGVARPGAPDIGAVQN